MTVYASCIKLYFPVASGTGPLNQSQKYLCNETCIFIPNEINQDYKYIKTINSFTFANKLKKKLKIFRIFVFQNYE